MIHTWSVFDFDIGLSELFTILENFSLHKTSASRNSPLYSGKSKLPAVVYMYSGQPDRAAVLDCQVSELSAVFCLENTPVYYTPVSQISRSILQQKVKKIVEEKNFT